MTESMYYPSANTDSRSACVFKLRQARKLLSKNPDFVNIVRDIDVAITSAQRQINKEQQWERS